MATYLVDYDTVRWHGLAGLSRLSAKNTVVLFLSAREKTLPVEQVMELFDARAKIVWECVPQVTADYLKVRLASYLGALVGEGKDSKVVIVSRDASFGAATSFWSARREDVTVLLQETIDGEPIDETKLSERIAAAFASSGISEQAEELREKLVDKAEDFSGAFKEKVSEFRDEARIDERFSKVKSLFGKGK
ncbi:MAG: hypothetical protein LBR00_04950 [Clostridiales Family XIII bacterium]|jgi:hypothetical protein|nr:hypothetical protein [Clostridiales Family XIII bacterium]